MAPAIVGKLVETLVSSIFECDENFVWCDDFSFALLLQEKSILSNEFTSELRAKFEIYLSEHLNWELSQQSDADWAESFKDDVLSAGESFNVREAKFDDFIIAAEERIEELNNIEPDMDYDHDTLGSEVIPRESNESQIDDMFFSLKHS